MGKYEQIREKILQEYAYKHHWNGAGGYCGCDDPCSCYDVEQARIQQLEEVISLFGDITEEDKTNAVMQYRERIKKLR